MMRVPWISFVIMAALFLAGCGTVPNRVGDMIGGVCFGIVLTFIVIGWLCTKEERR